ncbi:MAG: hypothetical protein IKB97_09425, partial [Bacteroidaceae bacterium]|nr:hypothetical protein [Bacteroidaceae bacterium]
ASALQAEGRRFESVSAHTKEEASSSIDKASSFSALVKIYGPIHTLKTFTRAQRTTILKNF